MERDRLPQPLTRVTQTFSGRTVEVLREMVVSGRLRPGERLNEVELAAALGISRGPLREAIQRLHSEGLVDTVPHRGAYVRTFTAAGLRELYEVRIALETHAVRLTGVTGDAAALSDLRRLLDDTAQALQLGPAYPRELDFHHRLVALAGNQALLQATVEVHRQIEMARSRSAHEPTRARAALEEHRGIVAHLTRGRTEAAVTALTTHLGASLDSAVQLLQRA